MSGETDRRIEQLLAALRDDNEALRDHAVASLGQLGAAAIERLINLFADEDRVIREAAPQAVVQAGGPGGPAAAAGPPGDARGAGAVSGGGVRAPPQETGEPRPVE